MQNSPQWELDALLGRSLLEQVPFNVAVIDRGFHVVAANSNFEEYFGDWRTRRCFEVYKGLGQPCAHCHVQETFRDGIVRVSDETGVDRHGRACHYVVHLAPLRDEAGQVRYVIEMTTDLTATRRWQREYDLFFERVPCYVLVVDRQFRIVRANEKFRESFGDMQGKFCYQACKQRRRPCPNCPAAQTFRDGGEHVSQQVGVHQDGSPAHYVVTSSALSRGEDGVSHVIEMATDIGQVRHLESELKKAHDFYESLIRNSPMAILAVDGGNEARIMNPAARALLEWKSAQLPVLGRLKQMLPPEFLATRPEPLELPETTVRSASGKAIPARFSAIDLKSHGRRVGRAAYIGDLRELKRMEQEMIEAERLGAVGQTVAGLAHTIKNLLMGLEGGMYIVDGGLRRGDVPRIAKGWDILQRNFEKTTTLVKDFLSFAKGRLPELSPTDPNALAHDVIDLYREAARLQGVELILEAGGEVRPAPLDRQGIETCLTNLISNAIDAAAMRDQAGGRVVLKTSEETGELVFEVADNGCGMDWEVKGKVFTTFFTTKGGSGTGLGLLTTRKIVQEHGGRIDVASAPGEGATFRIRLRRDRLEALAGAPPVPGDSAGQVKP
jgi:signal transduction histidine kinase